MLRIHLHLIETPQVVASRSPKESVRMMRKLNEQRAVLFQSSGNLKEMMPFPMKIMDLQKMGQLRRRVIEMMKGTVQLPQCPDLKWRLKILPTKLNPWRSCLAGIQLPVFWNIAKFGYGFAGNNAP